MERFGVSKDDVFEIIHAQKWRPISIGLLWAFNYTPIADYFNKNKDK
jgi:hypothetical protein